MAKRRIASPDRAEKAMGSSLQWTLGKLEDCLRERGRTRMAYGWIKIEREDQKWAVRQNLFRGLLLRRRNGCYGGRTGDVLLPQAKYIMLTWIWKEVGKSPLILSCTGASVIAVFTLAWVNNDNDSLARSSEESLGWLYIQIYKCMLPPGQVE